MPQLSELLVMAKHNDASDLHLSSNIPPVLRVNGEVKPITQITPLSPQDIKEMLYSVMNDHQKILYEEELEIDFAISFDANMRFRVNAFHGLHGPAAVFRTIPTKVLNLDDLKAPEILKKISMLEKGLVLVTGPTGSGKSTTLAAMINHINNNTAKHILTVEDPIEFIHNSIRSLINQREIGSHSKSFAKALKSALREDPDVILVGELRDLETIQLALTAAETGHLVMATLHTSSAPKTVDRIIDVFPAESQEMVRAMLSVSLEAVITQRLLRKQDGSGRVAAHEILIATPAVRNLIREAKIPQLSSLMQMGSKYGMQTMKDKIAELLENNIISREEARKHVSEDEEEGNSNKKPKMTNYNGF